MLLIKPKRFASSKAGFSLIEVTVSIYIITMGLLGLISLVNQNLQVQYINKNSIIASELAQEGLELVRNVRDDNWRDKTLAWDDYIFNGIGNNKEFAIDYRVKNDINTINKNTGPGEAIDKPLAKLYLDSDGYYRHYSGTVPADAQGTIFRRIVKVYKNSDTELTFTCTVRWSERGRVHNYVTETKLTNWKFPS